jgi:hypothetical protein
MYSCKISARRKETIEKTCSLFLATLHYAILITLLCGFGDVPNNFFEGVNHHRRVMCSFSARGTTIGRLIHASLQIRWEDLVQWMNRRMPVVEVFLLLVRILHDKAA